MRTVSRMKVADQLRELDHGREVVIPVSPVRLLLAILGCLAFIGVGALVIVLGYNEDGARTRANPFVWVMIAAILFFGVFGIPSILIQLLRPGRLVVGPATLRQERRRGSGWQVVSSVDWRDVVEVFDRRVGGRWPTKGTRLICYRARPASQQRIDGFRGGVQRAEQSMLGEGGFALPNSFRTRAQDLLELLRGAHDRFGGEATRPTRRY